MGSCDSTILVEELLISTKISKGPLEEKPLNLSPQLVPSELFKGSLLDFPSECKDILEKQICSELDKEFVDSIFSSSVTDPSDTLNKSDELKDEVHNIVYSAVVDQSHDQSEVGGSCLYDHHVKSEVLCLEKKSLLSDAETSTNLYQIFRSLHPGDEPIEKKDIMIADPPVRYVKEENYSININDLFEQNLQEAFENKCDLNNSSIQASPPLHLEEKEAEAVLGKSEVDGFINMLFSQCESVQKNQSNDIHGDNGYSDVKVMEMKEEEYNSSKGVEMDAYTNRSTVDEKSSNSDCAVGAKSSKHLCQTSRKSTHKSKSKRKVTREKIAREGRKTGHGVLRHHKTIEIILSTVSRRKRSFISKPARSFIWGSLENVSDLFERNIQPAFNKEFRQRSHKSRKTKGERENKRNGSEKVGIFMESKGKCNVPTNRIRLKIKFGKKTDSGNHTENILGVSSMLDGEIEGLGKVVENNGNLEPGTSPDSEVINQLLDSQVGLRVQADSSCDLVAPEDDGISLKLTQMKSKKGKKVPKENYLFPIPDHRLGSVENELFENFLPSSKLKNDHKLCTSKKSSRGTPKKSVSKSEVKKTGVSDKILCKVEIHPELGNTGGTNMGDATALGDGNNLEMVTNGKPESFLSSRNAWVSCDECQKWRRIAATLADSIEETNSKWTCKDNMDKAFADCSIPQEMSDAEINVELNISDEEDASRAHHNLFGRERKPLGVTEPSSWTSIKSNLYLHRRRRKQTIDEVMVCHCKPSINGRSGCRDECLNRMLNIECVQGTCPCGDRCSNQQFQKHKYAKLSCFRCGKKGHGLQLLEDISNGQFLIEYVGEVLDLRAYEARQVEYASRGHKHFYFMTLDGSEVIDACAKGNLGRFINHSCDPNCRTEKWMVNGEICIGLFAVRDIQKGEELTFDYNYVRVFGAAAKKCVCGSINCRGYIGGDPLSTEIIVQEDSDDEFHEPVMHLEGFNHVIPESIQIEDVSKGGNLMEESAGPVVEMEITTENKNLTESFLLTVTQAQISAEFVSPAIPLPLELPLQTADVAIEPVPIVHLDINPKQGAIDQSRESISHNTNVTNRKSQFEDGEEKRDSSKSQSIVKSSHLFSTIKKGKPKSNVLTAKKPPVVPYYKPKKAPPGSDNVRYEALEAKLNELLDADGGISKRNDSSKGYLKLLLLTAASGDRGNGEAIQSNRELSMILDALLKTKSRMVLADIINKNGLRMLHNIMKQSRCQYNKTPVLRKLLKIIEYLATKEILTLEHINGGPPCPGMESFKESILSLTEHTNKQVHQIARNFRDTWIPRPTRKYGCTERDDDRMGSNYNRLSSSQTHGHEQRGITSNGHQSDAAASPPIVAATTDNRQHSSLPGGNNSKIRKRKSRWDEPSKVNSEVISPRTKQQKNQPGLLLQDHDNVSDTMHEDVPPGFSHPLENSVDLHGEIAGPTKSSYEMLTGHPQERFKSYLPVSYGIPLPIMQQMETSDGTSVNNWIIAPGIAFHPFPPLPPKPHHKPSILNQAGESQRNSCSGMSGVRPMNINVGKTNNHNMFERDRGHSNDLGKRFRQQKWNNNHKLTPQWHHNGNAGPCFFNK